MDSLKDLIFRYCVLFGRRFSYKEKIAFLRIISKELIPLGYYVDAKLAKLKLAKKKYENYYNAYIGNLDKADVIVCTYYDTGVNYFNVPKIHAFEQNFDRSRYFLGLLPVFTLFIASVLLNFFVLVPNIKEVGFLSISGVLSILSTLLLFYFILKYKNGIPNKNNFVCNSSSILVILNLIRRLDKKSKKKIAFVLYDGGCTNQYGLKMFENYSDKIKKKKIIFLDSIGNGDSLVYFKPKKANVDLENISTHEGELDTAFHHYVFITAGYLSDNNKVIINNAHSRRDNTLSVTLIEQHTDTLQRVLMSVIGQDDENEKES